MKRKAYWLFRGKDKRGPYFVELHPRKPTLLSRPFGGTSLITTEQWGLFSFCYRQWYRATRFKIARGELKKVTIAVKEVK